MAPVPHQNSIWVNRNCRNKWTSRICQGAAPSSFGLLAHVSCSSPNEAWPGGLSWPLEHIFSSSRQIRVEFYLVLVFHRETDIFHCNYDTKSFCCELGPPFLLYTIVAISPFMFRAWTPYSSLLHTSAISDCVFILSCLCSSIRLQGKAFLARSIELCLVDNHQSSNVAVVDVQIATD
jgi:hypothetical protein